MNQLVRYNDNVSSPRRSYTFTYDAAGNIISKSTYAYRIGTLGTALSTVNYDYDGTWTDKLTKYNGEDIVYDDIGNPTSLLGATLSWSGRQLDTYTTAVGTVIEYSYDENGLRHEKSIYVNDVLTEKYNYTWANGRLINQVYTVYENNTPTSYAVKFIYDSFDTPQGFILNNDETYLYLKNIQGDIIAVVNESGESVLTYTYNAWGEFKQTVGAGDNSTVELMKKFLPFAYRGYCYDYDTGLYYLQSRYYSPEIGRFINADDTQIAIATQGALLGANLFSYCENNPVNYADFFGFVRVYANKISKGKVKIVIDLSDADIRKIKAGVAAFAIVFDTAAATIAVAGGIPSLGITVAASTIAGITVSAICGLIGVYIEYKNYGKGAKVEIYIKHGIINSYRRVWSYNKYGTRYSYWKEYSIPYAYMYKIPKIIWKK